MTRKTVIVWLSLVMVATLGFYNNGYSISIVCPGVTVPAPCGPVPTSCKLYDSCTGIDSGFTLEIFPSGDVWPIPPIPPDTKFKWNYKITDSSGNKMPGILSIATLAPNCCKPNNYTTGGTAIYQPGVGDWLSKFGVGNFQDWVVMLSTDNSTPPGYYFYSGQSVPSQRTTIQVKAGLKTYYCPSIAGPACPDEVSAVVSSTWEEIKFGDGDMVCLTKSPNFPCPIAVDCITKKELDSLPIEQVLKANPIGGEGSPEPVFYAGVPEQACPKIFLQSCPDCPNSTWVCSGGRCYYR